MAEISIDQSKLPGVKEVCRDFAVLEDHTLAHSLQEQEIEHHLATNVQRNRLVQYDLQMAKQLQEEEDRKARARIQERHKDLERQDCEIAQEIQVKLVIEAEQRRRQEEDDEERKRGGRRMPITTKAARQPPRTRSSMMQRSPGSCRRKSCWPATWTREQRRSPRTSTTHTNRCARGQGKVTKVTGPEATSQRGLPLRPPRIWTSFVTLQASRTWHIKHPDQSLLIKVTTINSRTNEAFFFLLILTLFCSKLCWNPSWRSPGFLPASKDLPGDGLLPEHRDVHKQCLFFSPLSFSLGDLPPVSWAGQLNLAFVGQLFHSPPLPSRILVLGSRRAVFRPPLPSEDLVGLGRGQPKQAQGRRVERAPQRSSSLTRCNAGITA
uniref:Coiled-coil domain containing 50 n=1 Tax=Podarcis muralis TaxID=64176 RepID=A0A670KHE4_PODMU